MDPIGPPQPPGPPQGPPFAPPKPLPPPTDPPVDYGQVMDLLRTLMTRTGKGNTITRQDLALLASDEDVSLGMVYAAAGMHPGIRFVREHEFAFAVCTGKCQMWGAFGLLDELLAKAEALTDTDKPSFDVIPQGCLNLCDEPPAIMVATPDGNGALPRCTSGDIDEALAMIFGGENEDG